MNISEDEFVMDTGTPVRAADGKAGRIDGLMADPTSGSITHLVLREGPAWAPKGVTMPIAEVERMKEKVVYLRTEGRRRGTALRPGAEKVMDTCGGLGSPWWQHAELPRQNPCLTCGACCAAFRVSFYRSESSEAVADAVPAEMTCQVAPILCAMRGTDQPNPRCAALQGSVGVRVWRAIYGRRPSVCREVTPSGQNETANTWCDRARAIWSLPPLMPVLPGSAGPAVTT